MLDNDDVLHDNNWAFLLAGTNITSKKNMPGIHEPSKRKSIHFSDVTDQLIIFLAPWCTRKFHCVRLYGLCEHHMLFRNLRFFHFLTLSILFYLLFLLSSICSYFIRYHCSNCMHRWLFYLFFTVRKFLKSINQWS